MIKPKTIEQLIRDSSGITLTNSCELYGSAPPGLRLLKVDTPRCRAILALQGAQLLEFQASGGAPLLWLSPKAVFSPGQAIRGGIPLCAPWFGSHPTDSAKPQHGFVRNSPWRLTAAHTLAEGICQLQLQFSHPGDSGKQGLYPWPFILELTLTLAESIEINLSITNLARETTRHSWALHSYHPIARLTATRVLGLPEIVHFDGEVDRVFEGVATEQIIDGTPRINIRGRGCSTAIVWNPGPNKAARLSDVGAAAYQQFICVERGAAGADTWLLAPKESRRASLIIREELDGVPVVS